jgi:carboxypeptidase family protein
MSKASSVGAIRLLGVGFVLVLFQSAPVTGVVTDSTGAVLPGVTVTAIDETSGNTLIAVTDERGGYRFPERTVTSC